MLPTRTAGENGRVGTPYGVRNSAALGDAAGSGRARPPHATVTVSRRQLNDRTRIGWPRFEFANDVSGLFAQQGFCHAERVVIPSGAPQARRRGILGVPVESPLASRPRIPRLADARSE